ncbi:MAG: hypothetical protein KDA72_11085 [Planctomycetales bacterium]|nr:hypothetical protein [Planctomycetales bacterium]
MIRNLLLSAAAALGALSMGATEASAQWGHHGGHHGVQLGAHHGGHHSSHYGGYHALPSYSSYYSGGLGYSSGYQVRRPVYHDTTHLDYHGPSLQRHGFHYHVVPGHYDVHHTGHFDH